MGRVQCILPSFPPQRTMTSIVINLFHNAPDFLMMQNSNQSFTMSDPGSDVVAAFSNDPKVPVVYWFARVKLSAYKNGQGIPTSCSILNKSTSRRLSPFTNAARYPRRQHSFCCSTAKRSGTSTDEYSAFLDILNGLQSLAIWIIVII